MDKPDVRQLVLDLMRQPTERDKQVKIGASNFSTMCNHCLALDLQATHGSTVMESHPYWLGAWLGTAMHNRLEEEAKVHRPTWVTESKYVMGEIPGYGIVKSTTDLYLPEHRTVTDYKSTTRAKLVFIKEALRHPANDLEATKIGEARFKVDAYQNQGLSYGRGLVLAGYPVEWVSLLFVCRDGTGDKDIWAHTFPFDMERAEKVWDRVSRMWAWLQNGHTPDELSSHPHCYACNHREDD